MIKHQGVFGPVVLAVFLGAGFAVVWAMVCGVVMTAGLESTDHWPYADLLFRADGTPVIQSYPPGRRDYWQYSDLAGNTLAIPDKEKWLHGVFLSASPPPIEPRKVNWSNRLRIFVDDHRPPTYWSLVADGKPGGLAYLVGYDSTNHGRIGFLGKGGFRENELPPSECFPFTGSPTAMRVRVASIQVTYPWPHFPSRFHSHRGNIPGWVLYIHADDNTIYQIDLEKRTVRVALTGLQVRSVAMLEDPGLPWDSNLRPLAVRTDEAVLLLNGRNEILHRRPFPAELRDQDFTWLETATGRTVAYTREFQDFWHPKLHYKLLPDIHFKIYQIDAGGHITQVQEAVLGSGQSLASNLRGLLAVVTPIPLVVDVVAAIVRPRNLLARKKADTFGQALGQGLQDFWPSLLLVHLFSAWLAWVCYRRQVLYAASPAERIVWPLFVFVTGLAGWVGYRYGRSWPPLETCPSCGVRVPRDRVACAHCQADFPLPAPRSTEVFALV